MKSLSRPHGLQPIRLLHPWDFPSKSTGVECHCLLCQMLPEYRYHLPWKITLCFAFYMVIHRASLGATMVKNAPIMQKTQFRSLVQEDPLEKEMATHSSILAWRIPRTEKPGGPQSMGSQTFRHNWATHFSLSSFYDNMYSLILYLIYYFSQIFQRNWCITNMCQIYSMPV